MIHLTWPQISEAELPACDQVAWNFLKYQHKKIALLGKSYLNHFGWVPQDELNHRPAYACFSPWLDTSRWQEQGEATWQTPMLRGDECTLFFKIQPGEKGSNQFSARKLKDNLEGGEAEPFRYITMDYHLDISPPSCLISFWASWRNWSIHDTACSQGCSHSSQWP